MQIVNDCIKHNYLINAYMDINYFFSDKDQKYFSNRTNINLEGPIKCHLK